MASVRVAKGQVLWSWAGPAVLEPLRHTKERECGLTLAAVAAAPLRARHVSNKSYEAARDALTRWQGSCVTRCAARQARIEDFIALCQRNAMPCSAFHFGSGYSSIDGKRYTFNWNRWGRQHGLASSYAEESVCVCGLGWSAACVQRGAAVALQHVLKQECLGS